MLGVLRATWLQGPSVWWQLLPSVTLQSSQLPPLPTTLVCPLKFSPLLNQQRCTHLSSFHSFSLFPLPSCRFADNISWHPQGRLPFTTVLQGLKAFLPLPLANHLLANNVLAISGGVLLPAPDSRRGARQSHCTWRVEVLALPCLTRWRPQLPGRCVHWPWSDQHGSFFNLTGCLWFSVLCERQAFGSLWLLIKYLSACLEELHTVPDLCW